MANIFISYRRSDSAPYAGRLYDRLIARFGEERVFMDLEIEPGEDFVARIEQGVSQCEVLLVLIGPTWLEATGDEGQRRLDDPADYARIEVVAALQRNIRVIPVLVGGAAMPAPGDLPSDLAPLARRQALELSDLRFHADADRLIEAIDAELEARALSAETRREELEGDREPRQATSPGRRGRLLAAGAAGLAAIAIVILLASGAFSGSGQGGDGEPGGGEESEGGGGGADVVLSGDPASPELAPNPMRVSRLETFTLVNVTGVPFRLNSGDQQTRILAGADPIPPLGSGAYLLPPDTVVTIGFDDPVLPSARLELRADDAVATLEIEFFD